jgi:hypothetical protein
MRLDLARIDDRIKRLQELRRIASDPEMARILLDCLSMDEEARERLPEPRPKAEVVGSRNQPLDEDPGDVVVREVLEGTWNKKRA